MERGMGVGEGEVVGRPEKTGGGGRISGTIEQVASVISLYRPSDGAPATRRYSAGHISEKPVALKRLVPETETKSSSHIFTADFTGKSRLFNSEMVDDKKPASECSLCGDVGFVQHLLLCKRCGYRLQHTYCSKLYPDLDMENWACEWCLLEEENNGTAKTMLGKRKTESRIKAFEFLLQIAQTSPSSSTTTSSDRQGHRDNGDAAKAIGIVSRKENGLKCGTVKVGKAEPRHAQTARYIMKANTLKLGHICENCKEDNAMKSGEQVLKKQRCSNSHHPSYKSNKALDNWRNLAKRKLHCSNTSKAIGRRYKLLADVLC